MEVVSQLLHNTKIKIERINNAGFMMSGDRFEEEVFQLIRLIVEEDETFKNKIMNIYQTGKLDFPDIVIELNNGINYGIEVKYSHVGRWESLGNSIFESTAIKGLNETFLFFGKRENEQIKVRYNNYQNCLSDVKVTHSPRFVINMDQDTSFFDYLDITYNQFRKKEKTEKGKVIKDFYKSNLKEGEEVWWIDKEESESAPTLTSYGNLDRDFKKKLFLEAIVLFPEIFSNRQRTKYLGVAVYWLTNYQVYHSSLRDVFSASGKVTVKMPEIGEYVVSRIYGTLFTHARDINYLFNECDDQFLALCEEKWEGLLAKYKIKISKLNIQTVWLSLIDKVGVEPVSNSGISPSHIFKAGMMNESTL